MPISAHPVKPGRSGPWVVTLCTEATKTNGCHSWQADPTLWPSCCRHLPQSLAIIGYARSKLTDESIREKVKPQLKGGSDEDREAFLNTLSYVAGSYDQDDGYQALQKAIKQREQNHDQVPLGRLFYLALPPSVYPQVCDLGVAPALPAMCDHTGV